jgi:hypothetical protein
VREFTQGARPPSSKAILGAYLTTGFFKESIMAQKTKPFVTLFVVSFLAMQTTSAISQSPQTTSSVRPVVRLDITAFDQSGNAVTDLKAEDLEVADGGKPQPIPYLRHDYDERGQSAKLPPGEFSNRNGGPNPRAIAILFDLLNESLENRGLVVAEMERELQKLEMADYVYLYLLAKDGSVSAVHPVPKPEELAHPSAAWTKQVHDDLDRAIQSLPQIRTQQLSRLNQPDFVKVTLDALAARGSSLHKVLYSQNGIRQNCLHGHGYSQAT